MKILLYAMKQEVADLRAELTDMKPFSTSWTDGVSGKFRGEDLLLLRTGAGKVQATMTTQFAVNEYRPSRIMLTGLSGAINPAYRKGDFVIGRDFIQHDVAAEEFGFEKGQIPFTDYRIIPATPALKEQASQLSLDNAGVHEGRILSGDQFISGDIGRYLRQEFAGDIVDMESAAVAFVCHLNNIPFIVGRTISDAADEDAVSDFSTFLSNASKHVVKFVEAML